MLVCDVIMNYLNAVLPVTPLCRIVMQFMPPIETFWVLRSEAEAMRGSLSPFRDMCAARWSNGNGDRSTDGQRRYGLKPPGTAITWSKLSEERVLAIEKEFRFEFPTKYRRFLLEYHKPNVDESRLLLTNWSPDLSPFCEMTWQEESEEEYQRADHDVDCRVFDERGELPHLRLRLGRAAEEAANAFHQIEPRDTATVDEWSHYVLPSKKKFVRMALLHEIAISFNTQVALADPVALASKTPDATATPFPLLIPIANGLSHFYVFAKLGAIDSEAVVAFSRDYSMKPCLCVVAPTLEQFLLRYYNGFSHQHRGYLGGATGVYDWSREWAPLISSRLSLHSQCTHVQMMSLPVEPGTLDTVPLWKSVLSYKGISP
jgi:hypothetical protein